MITSFKITNEEARIWQYYLRQRYNRPRTGLPKLLYGAIQEIIVNQAKKELDEIEKEWLEGK